MACPTYIQGISSACGTNLPGLKEVWIGQYDMATLTYTYLLDDNNDPILDADGNQIAKSISAAVLKTGATAMQKFAFRKNTASATNTLTVNDNGTSYWENSINMYFAKQDTDKRLSVQSLVAGETCAVAVDKNGNKWFYGNEDYLGVTEGTAETGAAPSDNNGYNITLTVTERSLPLPLSDAAFNVLTGQ